MNLDEAGMLLRLVQREGAQIKYNDCLIKYDKRWKVKPYGCSGWYIRETLEEAIKKAQE